MEYSRDLTNLDLGGTGLGEIGWVGLENWEVLFSYV